MKTIPITPVSELPTTCASSSLLALQVLDDSMAPEFTPGHVVVIDGSARIFAGSFVLVQHKQQEDLQGDESSLNVWAIRRWQPEGEQQVTLEALNPDWEDQYVHKDDVQVRGVVVQRAGRRRRERVHYR